MHTLDAGFPIRHPTDPRVFRGVRHTGGTDTKATPGAEAPSSGSTAGVEQRQLPEIVNQLYARAPIGIAATGVNAGLVVLILWPQVSPWLALAWLGCQLASAAVRYRVYRRFRRASPVDAREGKTWLLRFRAGALVSGLLWGASAVLLLPHDSLPHQLFLAFVLGGMVSGASGLFALDLTSFAAYSAPALAPVTVRLLAGGESFHLAMGGMVILFGALMSWVALQNHRSIAAALRLRAENLDLVSSLTAERDRAERLNQDLAEEIAERERAERDLLDHRNHLEELVEERTRGLETANEQLQEVIAQRRRADRQTSRIAREWTSTFDNMIDMVAVVGGDLKITRANRPLASYLSMHPRELVGKSCDEALHPEGGSQPECPHREAMRTGSPVTREVDDPRRGVSLLVTCSPFWDPDGNVLGSVHVARDISEQKRNERRREELIAELQQAVANVKLLSGLLPICSSCKKIRDDQGYWTQLEEYIHEHSEAEFSHGICPECAEELYPDYVRKRR